MKQSISYRLYKYLENIYVESRTVRSISDFLSGVFHILVNSKVFLLLSHGKGRVIFKNSLFFRSLARVIGLKTLFFHRCFPKAAVENSFFVRFTKDILDDKKKSSFQQINLILILTLLVNMGIKVMVGSFTLIGNKVLIGMLLALGLLYILDLDYHRIIKNSKVFQTAYDILYDQEMTQNHRRDTQ